MEANTSPEELDRLFDTVVGTVTLRAGDLGRQRDFYERAIGLVASEDHGERVVELADAASRPLIRLDADRSAGGEPLAAPHTGLFHTAFRYPGRAPLGAAAARALDAGAAFQGASDHGVSEAVYLADAEGNGIELYRDRPYDQWPQAEPGRVGMFTRPLDVQALVRDAAEPEAIATCDIGHIHLMTADIESTNAFYRDLVGLRERQRFGDQATFLAEGLYHHHLGANTWHSAGAPAAPEPSPGLDSFELRLLGAASVDEAAARLKRVGVEVGGTEGGVTFRDPDRNLVLLLAR